MNQLSNQERAAAKDAYVQKLADILFENRNQVPKKPIFVSHLRTHQWYIDLFELKAPLQNGKANLVFELFKKKLTELKN